MKLLHITIDTQDPISQVLIQEKCSQVIVLSIRDFVKKVNIFDECSMDKVNIHWEYQSGIINNHDNILLFSRISQIPNDIWHDFNKADQEYALNELEAYLGFALNAFHKLNPIIDEKGCVPCYSIPYQWLRIRNSTISVSTPEYYLGDRKFNHLTEEDVLYSSIYEYNLWSNTKISNDKTVFCFKKPRGVPIVCLVIYHDILISQPVSSQNIINIKLEVIKKIAVSIAALFNYFVSEILLFEDGEQITFGCISPYIIQSHHHSNFYNLVNDSISQAINDYEKNIFISRIPS